MVATLGDMTSSALSLSKCTVVMCDVIREATDTNLFLINGVVATR